MPTEPHGFRKLFMRDINKSVNPTPQWKAKRWEDYVGMVAWLGAIATVIAFVVWGSFQVIAVVR